MKQFVFFLFGLLTFSTTAEASDSNETEYHPFLKEGKVWNCQVREYVEKIEDGRYVGGEYQTFPYSLTLSGDSIVEGRTYHKMYREEEGGSPSLDWYALWREESRKVYVYIPAVGKEYLFYDFSLTPGQSADIYTIPTSLFSIDTVTVGEQQFRRFHVFQEGRLWIEGVGHPGGPFRVWGAEVNDGRTYTLLSCYEDGQCIFTADDFEAPTTTGIATATPQAEADVPLYDLQGRRLAGKPLRGLYIKDGKKIAGNN